MRARRLAAASLLCAGLAAAAAACAAPLGRVPFEDPFSPPAYRALTAGEQAQVELGQAVFNTRWLPAGTPGAGRRAGVGPLFNSGSCDSCHNSAKRGRGPRGDGPAPASLVIQLGTRAADGRALPDADPVYGHTLNTLSVEGVRPEAQVSIRYESLTGHYPDGTAWSLRRPQYEVADLTYGPLRAGTLIKPRMAPALFGLGLIEQAVAQQGRRATARFGWQGDVASIRDQTAKAFALEMGLTSDLHPHDDVTDQEHPGGGPPPQSGAEVAPELFAALVAFEQTMAVPVMPAAEGPAARVGAGLFARIGCAGCHQPELPVAQGSIAAYTDLRLHDLGPALADQTLGGERAVSRFRTAPLWAIAYEGHGRSSLELLHDGRARSVEEAILWHDGEAHAAKERFGRLSYDERRALTSWVAGL